MQSQSQLNKAPTKPKESHQFKALFLKSATLQSKQIGTNICQILTPIICLLFTYLIKLIATKNLNVSQDSFQLPYPFNTNNSLVFVDDYVQWYSYDASSPNVDLAFLGTNDGLGTKSGMLGNAVGWGVSNVSFEYGYTNTTAIVNQTVSTPFFRQAAQNINLQIANQLDFLNVVDLNTNSSALQDGAIVFKTLNNTALDALLFINDCRNFQYHRENGVTAVALGNANNGYITIAEGQLIFQDLINQAYIFTITGQSVKSGLVYMPATAGSDILVNSLINLVAATVFPLSLSLLFPVFLYAIVLEKEEKLIQMMKMNGMSMTGYWSVTFLFNLMLSFLTNLIFFLFGYFILDNTLFTQTSWWILFLTLFGWMLAQIGMSIFFQTFLSNSRSANIIGYLFSIWTSLIGASLSIGVYMYPGTEFPIGLQILAPFAFPRILYILLSACSLNTCITSVDAMPSELKTQILFLFVNFIFFSLIGVYLHEIIPQQFGIPSSPWFPIEWIWKRKPEDGANAIEDDPDLKEYIVNDEQEDDDSKKERVEVSRFNDDLAKYPLVCNNLRKLYKKQGKQKLYAAVKSFNLIIEPNQIFGLLGPNGAGKTTIISLITGMFQPDNGNAWVAGHSIKDDITKVHLEMGVCPQFDLLWPELTIEEHLYFYARLKGVGRADQKQRVADAITEVNLENFRTFRARQLSGGMKRRLSVAISMVGDPKIVFLDEPTTGLDPDNRRHLWSVLAKCKQKRAMFLTTHMMDEADTLCNRVGIITNGVLRTVANQIKLRKKYGGGYRLDINLEREPNHLRESFAENNQVEERQRQADKDSIDSAQYQRQLQKQRKLQEKTVALLTFVNRNFQQAQLKKVFNGNFIFKLGNKVTVSSVFEVFEKQKKLLGVAHWGVTNSSLEDVFMAVVETYDNEELLDEQIKKVKQEEEVKNEGNISESLSIGEDKRKSSVMST